MLLGITSSTQSQDSAVLRGTQPRCALKRNRNHYVTPTNAPTGILVGAARGNPGLVRHHRI